MKNTLLCSPILLFSVVCLTSSGYAQTGSVSGQITDELNQPLRGATIQISETTIGTSSNSEGTYLLDEVPAGEQTLVVSFIGYLSQRRQITVQEGEQIEVDFMLSEDLLGMDELIVSGTFNPATKLESSTAISTLNPEYINNRVPRGTADLLRAAPGLQVTSTYGEVGADVTVRGLPRTANSSFRYISLQEDGLRALEPPGLLFAFPDAFVRQDETISTVEVVRGGSAPVFTSNTPGGIVNFISKTGGPELSGTLKSSIGFHRMVRQDFNLGGPLFEDWRFNIGGYYRHDEGVRATGYPTDRGGQLKLNLTRDFERGFVRFYTKYLREKNVWYMGTPFQNYKNPEPISGGPELGTGTSYSPERRVVTIPDAYNRGSDVQKNMDTGFSVDYKMFGLETLRELGNDWNLTLKSRLINTKNIMNLMIDVADPFPVMGFGQPNLPSSVPRIVRFVNSGETISDQNQVSNLNGNGLMTIHGFGFSEQDVTNFISDIRVNKEIGNHNLNAGLYFSSYRVEWNLVQAGVFMEVSNQPRLLQIMIPDQEGNPMGLTPADGFAAYNSNYWNVRSYTDIGAFYLGDQWNVNDQLNIEAGIRFDLNFSKGANERPVVPGSVVDGEVVGQEVPAGYPSFTPTPQDTRNGQFGSGRYRMWDFTFSNIGGSIGANYKISDKLALYTRGSRGNRVPTVQEWALRTTTDNQVTGDTRRGKVEYITQFEAGMKAQGSNWSFLLTGFYSKSEDLISTLHIGQPDGSFAFLPITADTRTIGAEIEAVVRPIDRLELRLITTLQDPRFTTFEYELFIPGDNEFSGTQERNYKGNQLNDIARLLADFNASYSLRNFTFFGSYRYTGERMANRPNTLVLPGYGEAMAGIVMTSGNISLGLRGTNLFNTQAIDLMASRTGENILNVNDDGSAEVLVTSGAIAGTTNTSFYTTGQGILPRMFLVSATYNF